MVKIVQIDWKKEEETGKLDETNILRQIAGSVSAKEFGTVELKTIIQNLKTAMEKEIDGVAIAAPQIGIEKRIFVIKEEAYTMLNKKAKAPIFKPVIFINPKIIKASKKMLQVDEGCLSVRPLYGTTLRHANVTIEAYTLEGNKFTYGASGLIAHIFQHEIDHLEGILFIDHAENIQEVDLEEVKKAIQDERKEKSQLTKNYEKL